MSVYDFTAKIGVFDSGIGGQALANELERSFPNATITVVDDAKNVPYGSKTQSEIIKLTDDAIQPLLQNNSDVIVIACNTATALAIDYLRNKYLNQKFIGIEPMIKSAAQETITKVIGVCATPATLQSERYKKLITKYAQGLMVLEPDCSSWAQMIEKNNINQAEISITINNLCAMGADVIVLGCTHYHWIKSLITQLANGQAKILEPSQAIAKRVAHVLGDSL